MREMAENLPYDHLPRQPNVENITADEYRHRILSAALRMNGWSIEMKYYWNKVFIFLFYAFL